MADPAAGPATAPKVPAFLEEDQRGFSPSLSPTKTDHGATGDSNKAAKPSTSKTKPKTTKTVAAAASRPVAAAAKPRKAASHAGTDHPKYAVMMGDAIKELKERKGSSRQAILKFIVEKYHLGEETNKINARLKLAIKAGMKSGNLKQTKGTGASGSFQLVKGPDTSRSAAAEKASKPRSKIAKGKKLAASTSGKAKAAAKTPKKPAKKEAKAGKSPTGKSPAGKKTATKAAAKVVAGASKASKTSSSKSARKQAKTAKSPKEVKKAAAGKRKFSVKTAPAAKAGKVGTKKAAKK